MRTNIDIDPTAMADAMRVLRAKTKKEAVDTALREIVRLRQQAALMQLWGSGWEGDLNDMRTSKYIADDA